MRSARSSGSARIDQDPGAVDELGQRRDLGGDHRGPARHGLEHREPESLVQRRVHQRVGAAQERGLGLVGDVAGQDDAPE
jgi:hypothetical protein